MKKTFIILLVTTLFLSFIISGCTSSQSGEDQGDGGKYLIRLAHVVPETHATHLSCVNFKKKIEERTNGKVQVELYPNAQLGSDRQILEACMVGNLEMAWPGSDTLAGFVPEYELVGAPFLFNSLDAVRNALDGEFGEKLDNLLLEKYKLLTVGHGEVGFRTVTNSRNEILSPADMKGLKIRTMENPIHIALFKSLGANPTPMAFNELFTALQQKTVDAQDNPVALTYNSKFYEVQKYLTLTEHVYTGAPMVISQDFFNTLSDDIKNIVIEVGKETVKASRDSLKKQTDEAIAELEKAGMKVTVLTSDQKKVFMDAVAPVQQMLKDKYGEDWFEIANKYNE